MTEGTVLKITDLTKKYKSLVAVDHISFSINHGEIVGLLGPNGAGKTTTINMILGILEPTYGAMEILGRDSRKSRSDISRKINFAAVYAHMPANLTVWQNLYIFGLLYGIGDLRRRIDVLIKEFDLDNFVNTRAGLLSSGEMSRLNLAKALMNEPQLLLLDEPTASLDPSISRLVREKIKEYAVKTRAGILWTSHNMSEIEAVCDRVLFLSRGTILLSGDPRTLAAQYGEKNLEELFITVARETIGLKE